MSLGRAFLSELDLWSLRSLRLKAFREVSEALIQSAPARAGSAVLEVEVRKAEPGAPAEKSKPPAADIAPRRNKSNMPGRTRSPAPKSATPHTRHKEEKYF